MIVIVIVVVVVILTYTNKTDLTVASSFHQLLQLADDANVSQLLEFKNTSLSPHGVNRNLGTHFHHF